MAAKSKPNWPDEYAAWSPKLQPLAEQKWLIDGVLLRGCITLIYGLPQTYKSFIAMGMASAISNELPWMGRETTKGVAVIYIAAEGGRDVHERRAAADWDHGRAGPLAVIQARPQLDDATGFAMLKGIFHLPANAAFGVDYKKYLTPDELERYEEKLDDGVDCWDWVERTAVSRLSAEDKAQHDGFSLLPWMLPEHDRLSDAPKEYLVIIDTYSQCSSGDDRSTVSRVMKNLAAFQDLMAGHGLCVSFAIIDHSTKDGTTHMGALEKVGDPDAVIEVNRRGEVVTLVNEKMRAAAKFEPIRLRPETFTLDGYLDAQGRPVTTLVMRDDAQGHKLRQVVGTDGDSAAALLLGLFNEAGPCGVDDLRARFRTHPDNLQKKPASVGKAFRRALNNLVEQGLVAEDDDMLTLPAAPVSTQDDPDAHLY